MLDEGFQVNFEKIHPETNDLVLAELQLKTARIESNGLKEAMFDLREEFKKLCEITISPDNILTVKEVNLKHDSDKGIGCQMIAELYLKNTKDNAQIKTPFVWEDSNDPQERMSPNLVALINEVTLEAKEFIEKEHDSQLEMFSEAS